MNDQYLLVRPTVCIRRLNVGTEEASVEERIFGCCVMMASIRIDPIMPQRERERGGGGGGGLDLEDFNTQGQH